MEFKTEDTSSVRDKSEKKNFNVVDGFFIPKKSVTYKEDKVNYSNGETISDSSETFSSSSVSSIKNQSKYSITSPAMTLFTKTNSGSFRPEFTTFSSASSLDWASDPLSTEEVFISLYHKCIYLLSSEGLFSLFDKLRIFKTKIHNKECDTLIIRFQAPGLNHQP